MTYLACLISGILAAIPMLFDGAFLLEWVALAPLFYIFIKEKPKYRHGLVFSFGFYGVLYYWFTNLYPMDFAGLDNAESLALVIICWVGLALLQSSGTAFVGVLFRIVKGKHRWIYPLYLACCWTVLEWVQSLTWVGVPFFRLAISQCSCARMIQGASLLGSLFVSFLIAFANGCFALGFLHENEAIEKQGEVKKFRFRPNIAAAIGASVIAVNYILGFMSILYYEDSGEVVNAAVIQGNISSTEKWNGSVSDTCDIYCELTEKACINDDCQLVVWPETVINVNLSSSATLQSQIADTAKKCGCYIVVGAFDKVSNENSETETYNALILFNPDGTISDEKYYKRHLVPFGEYLPLRSVVTKILPLLSEMNMFSSDISAGNDSSLMECEYGNIGGLVCFDSIYDVLARDSVSDGANIIALSTNDSWYGDTAAVYQHNKHAILRAVENGRYVLRAANTGVSSIISPTGQVITGLEPLERGYTTAEVCFKTGSTPYNRVGNVIVIICFIILAIGLFAKRSQTVPTGNSYHSGGRAANQNIQYNRKYKRR